MHPPGVRLRPTTPRDLPALFELQSDPASNEMAGTKPRAWDAYRAVWDGVFADPGARPRVIEQGGAVVGSIGCFRADGRDCVGYWIARDRWGAGLASRALALFLEEETRRPLHATAARDNAPSRRVLEKCGFRLTGLRAGEETDRFVAREIADYVLD